MQLPVIIGGYHIPAGNDPDIFALEVLQQILSGGESSRLYQRARAQGQDGGGGRRLRVRARRSGAVPARSRSICRTWTSRSCKSGARRGDRARSTATKVDARELQKAKNQLAARAVYQRERVTGLASNIGVDWVVAHDPSRPFTSAGEVRRGHRRRRHARGQEVPGQDEPEHADAGAGQAGAARDGRQEMMRAHNIVAALLCSCTMTVAVDAAAQSPAKAVPPTIDADDAAAGRTRAPRRSRRPRTSPIRGPGAPICTCRRTCSRRRR